MSAAFFVYILASGPNGTLYVGMTNDLVRKVFEHRSAEANSFTKTYGIKRLVYFEQHDTAYAAITRDKRLKKWPRDWKMNLIERENPQWLDCTMTLPGLDRDLSLRHPPACPGDPPCRERGAPSPAPRKQRRGWPGQAGP